MNTYQREQRAHEATEAYIDAVDVAIRQDERARILARLIELGRDALITVGNAQYDLGTWIELRMEAGDLYAEEPR